MQRLQLTFHTRHHCIPTFGLADQELDQIGVEERHIAGDEKTGAMTRNAQPRIDPAERAGVGDQVGDHLDTEVGVAWRVIGNDQNLREERPQAVHRRLDQPLAPEFDKGLIETHPRGLAARQHNTRHLQASSSTSPGSSRASRSVTSNFSISSPDSASNSTGVSSNSTPSFSSSSFSTSSSSLRVSPTDRLRNQVAPASGPTSSTAPAPSTDFIS